MLIYFTKISISLHRSNKHQSMVEFNHKIEALDKVLVLK